MCLKEKVYLSVLFIFIRTSIANTLSTDSFAATKFTLAYYMVTDHGCIGACPG